jgi:hypothetical protein
MAFPQPWCRAGGVVIICQIERETCHRWSRAILYCSTGGRAPGYQATGTIVVAHRGPEGDTLGTGGENGVLRRRGQWESGEARGQWELGSHCGHRKGDTRMKVDA